MACAVHEEIAGKGRSRYSRQADLISPRSVCAYVWRLCVFDVFGSSSVNPLVVVSDRTIGGEASAELLEMLSVAARELATCLEAKGGELL